jgi:uncharacterized protein (DUF433 family)
MELEEYFDFLSPEDIRIKGTRIGIETVLEAYLGGASPEEIAVRYRSLSLEQIYVTITYYLCNQPHVEAYLAAWRQHVDQAAQAQYQTPDAVVRRIRRLKAPPIQAVRSPL